MLEERWKLSTALLFAGLLIVTANNAAAVELAPSPNPGGNTIIISTTDVESHGEPYETFGTINIVDGGVLTNFREFTILSGIVSVESGGRLVNDADEGVFTVDEVGSLSNLGIIDNYGRLKNSWSFSNALGSVFNNYVGAALTNTNGMDQRGTLVNSGGFLNSVDVFSGDGAALQNVGLWTNTVDSVFTNLGVVENFGTISNSGFMQNRLGASGGITQGKISNRNTINNLAEGVIINEYRWFNRSGSTINNSGIFTNSIGGLGLSNESGSSINNLAGGIFKADQVVNNAGQINNAGTFNISATGAIGDTGGGTYTQTDGSTIVNGQLDASDIDIQGGSLTGTGTLNGPVTIGAEASIGPGSSPGSMTINGDIDLNGLFLIEIGGLTSGTEYDVLNVTGTANLGGTLDVDFFDLGGGLFGASLGDTFDILTAETLSGKFDVFTLAILGAGLDWQIDYLFDFNGSTDFVRLSVVSAVPVPSAVWLFGSGLLGLVGMARRKKA
jgi:hypothetical protein